MPKSKKKPRPAWDTLFDALKENGDIRDMTNVYLEIQFQASLFHNFNFEDTFETPVYCYENLSATLINVDIFQESYVGNQLKSKIDFVMRQNWKNLGPKTQLEKLIKELGKFQKP